MNREKWEIDQEWRCTAHAIVKYKPEYYDEKGNYTKDEWGCMGDIGRVYDGHLLTIDEYLEIEQKYIDAVIRIMDLTGSHFLTISYLGDTVRSTKYSIQQMLSKKNRFSKYDKLLYNTYMKIIEGKRIYVKDIDSVIRLNLREYTYTGLTNFKNGLEIHFGYDYYMYCNSKLPTTILQKEVHKAGLYLDPFNQKLNGCNFED